MRGAWGRALAGVPAALVLFGSALAAPEPAAHDYVIKDFRFGSGESLPELKIHYYTLGTPKTDAAGKVTNAVLILHGTGGTGRQFLSPQFADVLFVPGGLLDPAKYFIVLPDGIGHGGSSKPSDGLRTKFPKYDYADMIAAHHALVADGLKVDRLRLLMGTSMGCMHGFMWAETWPQSSKAFMPLACLPVEIAGRNRLWRKMAIDAVKADPAWNGGDYASAPVQGLRTAQDLLILVGASPLPMQNQLPTREAVDAWIGPELARRMAPADANDLIYQLDASRTYDPSKNLAKISAPVTWVNSADDFINPPELGIAEREARRLKTAKFVLIPASAETHGHGTHTWAALWQGELAALLKRSE
ncbi:alpha/beta fold hydrolase [Phenylobacterium sp.]|uniref:alpha/beta fold hydrolase n=1 Tax=Phenylobacterium sp. TaxID=1871053 RepID=UPI0025E645B2|nr:alpha/beta fold hydrolase [Phenylobacterium sp.]